MRRRIAIPLIAVLGAAPWFWFHPEKPTSDQPARFSTAVQVPKVGDWVGGFSGLEIDARGQTFVAVTDRGHLARGQFTRDGKDDITKVSLTADQVLVPASPADEELPRTDAEGLALDRYGRLLISFEHDHRVLRLDTWGVKTAASSTNDAWHALAMNGGLEALAIDGNGTLYAIPENIASGATRALVFTLKAGADWQQTTTIPIDPQFKPVGADFGPDGQFYLLERGIYPFGFYSRVRRMTLSEDRADNIVTLLHTPLFRHSNLEGLAVWRDTTGSIRLTMVSDDNFLPFVRGEIVEYVLQDGVAQSGQAD